MTNSAASFIDQINAAYREVVKAEGSALPHAIRCGEFLNLAKENLKAEKGGKWSDWLAANCTEIPETTASLYMRLAENKKLAAKAKSIREANEVIRKANNRTRWPSAQPDASEPAGGFVPESKPSPRLEDELANLGPDELCIKLVDSWDDDELVQLAKLIGEHLQKKKLAATSNTVASSPTT